MLNDYITAYIKARKENDKKSMQKIENELASLGMDKSTLKVLADAIEKER